LIAGGNAIATRPQYSIEAYKQRAGVRVGVATAGNKAVDTMQLLEKVVKAGDDPAKSPSN